ncbi:hypothetical protein vseg_010646 [Gypsophila vaccaria]
MRPKLITLFGVISTTIALISITSVIVINTNSYNSFSPPSRFAELVTFEGVLDVLELIEDGFWSLYRHRHHHHHRRRREMTCNMSQWMSKLTSLYDASTVYTVDLKGCGNFTSVQKAVDAVPYFSSSPTLIVVYSGLYRLVFTYAYFID